MMLIRQSSLALIVCLALFACQPPKNSESAKAENPDATYIPSLKVNEVEVDTLCKAFSVAIGDLASNLKPYKGGLMKDSATVMIAGIDYYGTWARDGAISTSNGIAMIAPEATRNTLLSQMKYDDQGRLIFGGEYWDNLHQAKAHYDYYLATGDTTLLFEAYTATKNTLADRERDELDEQHGLFRGAAGFNDGIAGYPDLYANTGTYVEGGHWRSNIKKWPEEPSNAPYKAKKGFGLPLMALSTNCVIYMAYQALQDIGEVIGKTDYNKEAAAKAAKLKAAINKELWNDSTGNYRYFIDPNGNSNHQEGMGISYAINAGIADQTQAQRLMKSAITTPAGMPCLWPGFDRYNKYKSNTQKHHYPRHAQVVWGMIQTFWCKSAKLAKDTSVLFREFNILTKVAMRDMQFREIYHPETGLAYGGVQEDNDGKLIEWKSTERQTWTASGYFRVLVEDIAGLTLTKDGIMIAPNVPHVMPHIRLENLHIRGVNYKVEIIGTGNQLKGIEVNGSPVTGNKIPYVKSGVCKVMVRME